MQYRATLRYSEALVNQAVRSYWRRSLGLGVFIGVPVIVAMFVLRLAQGDRSWLVGFLAAAVLLGVGMPIFAYRLHYRNSMAKFREMTVPVATLVAEETSFTLASDKGTSTLKWDAITEIWRFEGFWLFLFSKAHFATIPLEGVPNDMRSYIVDRVQETGGKVAD